MTEPTAKQIQVLMSGGPALRLRTARDLEGQSGRSLAPLIAALANWPPANALVAAFTGDCSFNMVHGARRDCFENLCVQAAALGIGKGFPGLDQAVKPYLRAIAQGADGPAPLPFSRFQRTVIAAGLAQLGYADAPGVKARLERRLAACEEGIGLGDPFQPAPTALRGAFAGRPLVSDAVANGGELRLPWIHDLLGWRAAGMADRAKAVAAWVTSSAYQSLPRGYGLVRSGRRIYAMGWSVHFAGLGERPSPGQALFQLTSLAAFGPIAKSDWFTGSLAKLDAQRTPDAFWRFPRSWAPRDRDRYAVNGGANGLGETGRDPMGMVRESTFWRLWIARQAA